MKVAWVPLAVVALVVTSCSSSSPPASTAPDGASAGADTGAGAGADLRGGGSEASDASAAGPCHVTLSGDGAAMFSPTSYDCTADLGLAYSATGDGGLELYRVGYSDTNISWGVGPIDLTALPVTVTEQNNAYVVQIVSPPVGERWIATTGAAGVDTFRVVLTSYVDYFVHGSFHADLFGGSGTLTIDMTF